jgi:hypothetical protein
VPPEVRLREGHHRVSPTHVARRGVLQRRREGGERGGVVHQPRGFHRRGARDVAVQVAFESKL